MGKSTGAVRGNRLAWFHVLVVRRGEQATLVVISPRSRAAGLPIYKCTAGSSFSVIFGKRSRCRVPGRHRVGGTKRVVDLRSFQTALTMSFYTLLTTYNTAKQINQDASEFSVFGLQPVHNLDNKFQPGLPARSSDSSRRVSIFK